METAQSLSLIACLTDLNVSHFECLISLCDGLIVTGLILNDTWRSFLAQGISGNKCREFPKSVPIPLPVC